MNSCDTISINGGCGMDCPVLREADCPIEDEIVDMLKEQGLIEELIDWGLIEDDYNPHDAFDDAMEILK